jgi:hypothetical protein
MPQQVNPFSTMEISESSPRKYLFVYFESGRLPQMLRTIRSTPVSALFVGACLCLGPIAVGFRGEYIQQNNSKFHLIPVKCAVPGSVATVVITGLVLFLVRYIENVIGSLWFLFVVALAYSSDWFVRFLVEQKMGGLIPGSGPYAVMMALSGLYAVFLPTMKGVWIGVNEKVVVLVGLISVVVVDGLRSLLPMAVGFVVFLVTAPLFYPVAVKNS